MGNNLWVSPRGDKWAAHVEGNEHETKLFDTQREAQDYAIELAKKYKSEVIVQRKDGQIRSKDSYGNDPRSSRDSEH